MGRVESYYRNSFEWALRQLRARQLERGVHRILQLAEADAVRGNGSREFALAERETRLLRRSLRQEPPKVNGFVCDAGLGGLARWLRACGYRAVWDPSLDDAAVIREAAARGFILLTTDSGMMERGVLRYRKIPSIWIPPHLKIPQQLKLVRGRLSLVLQPAFRCMACGGQLDAITREEAGDRIPPRTARWLNQFHACTACGKLYWEGTHWQRIQAALRQ